MVKTILLVIISTSLDRNVQRSESWTDSIVSSVIGSSSDYNAFASNFISLAVGGCYEKMKLQASLSYPLCSQLQSLRLRSLFAVFYYL